MEQVIIRIQRATNDFIHVSSPGKLIETETEPGEFEEEMDGDTTDELPNNEDSGQAKIVRQIKFTKRPSDDKAPRKGSAKVQRLEEG